MHKQRRSAAMAAAGVLASAALVGCGGSSKSSTSATQTTKPASPVTTSKSRTYASLKLAWGVPDFLDPGLSYDARGWNIMEHVYLGLLTYKRTSGPDSTQLIPGLAEKLPDVSADGLTYTFKLRPGLKYSDGTAVHASDFRSTIERVIKLASGGATFYNVIDGAKTFATTKKGHISGIIADDAAGTITIKLTKKRGDFQNVVAMMFASLVPSGTPAKDQSSSPIAATGPYMITAYKPNRSFALQRNPNWAHIPGIPDGNPDRISGKVVNDDTAALQQVVNGDADFDQHTVPPDRIAPPSSRPTRRNSSCSPLRGRGTSSSTTAWRRSTTSSCVKQSTSASTARRSSDSMAAWRSRRRTSSRRHIPATRRSMSMATT